MHRRLNRGTHLRPGTAAAGRNTRRPPFRTGHGRIAQLVEQLTLNQRVLGSSPSAPTKNPRYIRELAGIFVSRIWAIDFQAPYRYQVVSTSRPLQAAWDGFSFGHAVTAGDGRNRSVRPCLAGRTATENFHAGVSRPSTLRESMLCLPREVPERRHDPVGRFFREKVPAVLKLVQLMIRQRGLPPLEFLPSERNVLQAPEKERRLVGKGRAVVPDGASMNITGAGESPKPRAPGLV